MEDPKRRVPLNVTRGPEDCQAQTHLHENDEAWAALTLEGIGILEEAVSLFHSLWFEALQWREVRSHPWLLQEIEITVHQVDCCRRQLREISRNH